jgi:hypothetical protein
MGRLNDVRILIDEGIVDLARIGIQGEGYNQD